MSRQVSVDLNAVIFAVTDDEPRILTVIHTPVDDDAEPVVGLPYGSFDPEHDRTLELGLRAWVREQTGSELGYVEQLYTFADRERDPRERFGGPRLLSVAYLALVEERTPAQVDGASWMDCYRFFPWEDWRQGRPALIDEIEAALYAWAATAPDTLARGQRRERIEICFGLGEAGWDGYRVLERYELLYEAALIQEAWRDRGEPPPDGLTRRMGRSMAFDHRRIFATALGRLRGKLRYRPVVFELVRSTFTLLQLQRVVEALAGLRLHKQNFRRLVERSGLVERTGRRELRTGGRPAELFRFRREVLRERRAPGVGSLVPAGD